ncbi:MAG: DUF2834 domain-containing protein [Pararhodobacter sp.]|nr:DUF2834 domain-containing protein [Pararhodobacter sp.]
MPPIRMLWLALAIWGTLHPMYWFVTWFMANEWSILAMVDAWHANAATSGLVWDLTVAAVVLTVWVLTESIRTGNLRGLWAIPATFCIGVSCGLPLYLFLRGEAAAQCRISESA